MVVLKSEDTTGLISAFSLALGSSGKRWNLPPPSIKRELVLQSGWGLCVKASPISEFTEEIALIKPLGGLSALHPLVIHQLNYCLLQVIRCFCKPIKDSKEWWFIKMKVWSDELSHSNINILMLFKYSIRYIIPMNSLLRNFEST